MECHFVQPSSLRRGGSCASATGFEIGDDAVPILYIIGGVVSLGLLVYLFVALLKPEAFQ